MNIEVNMGKIAIAGHKEVENLTSTGIGSCIVITLYDPELKLGAICHPMLSSSEKTDDGIRKHEKDPIYIDTAIDEMLGKMLSRGAVREQLEAKIIGAANMFTAFKPDIPKKNVASAKEKLKTEGIKLIGECVGGSIGRSVELALDTGIVTVKTKF
ncbi:MAG: chemotaxis protein CheD [Candidatus Omnitrophota bacterium]